MFVFRALGTADSAVSLPWTGQNQSSADWPDRFEFPEFGRHFDNIHSKAAHAVLKAAPNAAAIAGLSLRRLQGLDSGRQSRPIRCSQSQGTQKIGDRKPGCPAAGSCSGAAHPLDDHTAGVLRTAAAQLDLPMQRLFCSMAHPIKTIPGIGSITGPLTAAELADLRRFAGRRPLHALLVYAGMVLGCAKAANGAAKSRWVNAAASRVSGRLLAESF
jgi:hypothetical protein